MIFSASPLAHHVHRAVFTFVGMFILVPVFLARALLAFTRSSRSGSARSMCCSARCVGGDRRARAAPALVKLGLKAPLVNSWASATRSTCGWIRNTCAARRSIPRKARPWASASGMRWSISDPVAYLFKNADPRGSLRRQREQLHRPLPEQHEARRHARRTAIP